jgi:hypothetical protein
MSMAVRFKDTTKQMCSVLVVVQVSLLTAAGVALGLGLPYYTVTVASKPQRVVLGGLKPIFGLLVPRCL